MKTVVAGLRSRVPASSKINKHCLISMLKYKTVLGIRKAIPSLFGLVKVRRYSCLTVVPAATQLKLHRFWITLEVLIVFYNTSKL